MTVSELPLWDFQAADVKKLASQTSALITNDMGTGKTITALALDLYHRAECVYANPKTLVVAPLNTHETVWARHFKQYAPHLKVSVINPKNRSSFLNGADVFVVHWEALRLMPELQKVVWYNIIADEVHKAQSRKAQQTRALKALKTKYKTGLSGTPVTVRTDGYWSVLNWLKPQLFRSYWKFFEQYVDYEVVYPQGYRIPKGPKNEQELLRLIEPFTVRHQKKGACCAHHPKGVLPDLPEKYYSTITVELLPPQRRAYEQMRREMIAWVGRSEDDPIVAPVVIAKLVRLQQFATAYAELEDGHVRLSEPSSKLDALVNLINDNPSQQFVVFSQFSQLIRLLEKRLAKEKIASAILTGETPKATRGEVVKAFQDGRARVFAGTIKAGGVGIDLFTASTVVFLDRDWSPAENHQAEDRLHRAGQRNAVQVIDIIAQNTLDRERNQGIEMKWQGIKRLLGDA